MSDVARGRFVLGAALWSALLLALPAGLWARAPQSTQRQARTSATPATVVRPGAVDSMRTRLETLTSGWSRAMDREWEAERTRSRTLNSALDRRLDTARIGPLRLIGYQGEAHREAARRMAAAWEGLQELHGIPSDLELRAPPLVLSDDEGDPLLDYLADPEARVIRTGTLTPAPPYRRRPSEELLTQLIMGGLPLSIRTWVPTRGLAPVGSPRDALRQLLLYPSSRARACLDGAHRVCLALLGVPAPGGHTSRADGGRETTTAAARLATVFPEEELRELGRPGGLCGPEIPWSTCLETAAASPLILELAARTRVLRGSLFRMALELGGGAGLQRAVDLPEDAPLARTLETLARRPLPELLQAWRAWLGGDPRRPGVPVAPFLWAGAFGLLSLGSTRWRF